MTRRLATVGMAAVLGLAALAGYRLIRSDMTVEVYRERLAEATRAHGRLADRFNEVVKRTAVTELVVAQGRMSVVVRNATGVVCTISTPYDPAGEIYVDYVVAEGRLWIRRVYDADTPPSKGQVIDPQLADFDWDQNHDAVGKAVYRRLHDGRWIVTVSGDGSLGLAHLDPGEPEPELAPPPPVKSYEQVEAELGDRIERIGPAQVLRRFSRARKREPAP